MSLPHVEQNTTIDLRAVAAADRFSQVWRALTDRSYWPLKMFVGVNVWLWHLDAFAKDEDPVPLFVDMFDRASGLLEAVKNSGVCCDLFPLVEAASVND